MKRQQIPAVPAPRAPADAFVAGAPGKQRLPWEGPMVRTDLDVSLNTRLSERMKLQLEWVAAQRRTSLRDVVEQAVAAHLRRELAELGISQDAG